MNNYEKNIEALKQVSTDELISKIENACSVIDSHVYETTIVEGSIEFFNQRD